MPKPNWVVSDRSKHLNGRATSNTQPEIALRKNLYRQGARYRLNRYIVDRFKADIAFPSPRIAVMVDGCFWHGCPQHGRKSFNGPNAPTWRRKIETNKNRDSRATSLMEAAGWTVLRFWECQIHDDVDDVTHQITQRL